MSDSKKPEAVDHPAHYGGADNPYEAIKVIEAWGLGFCLGNTVKYLARAGKKDPAKELEDCEKAAWYLQRHNSHGACVPCGRAYRKETYQRERARRVRQAAERAKADPDGRRDQQRAFRLGVPVAEVRRVIAAAGGQCEACGRSVTNQTLCVDHDHVTGTLRGVLCRFCNVLEGMLSKHPERISQVQEYLARKGEG